MHKLETFAFAPSSPLDFLRAVHSQGNSFTPEVHELLLFIEVHSLSLSYEPTYEPQYAFILPARMKKHRIAKYNALDDRVRSYCQQYAERLREERGKRELTEMHKDEYKIAYEKGTEIIAEAEATIDRQLALIETNTAHIERQAALIKQWEDNADEMLAELTRKTERINELSLKVADLRICRNERNALALALSVFGVWAGVLLAVWGWMG
jgi:hypothetical protein